jgi:site-specific DNA-methyltransferase (adenine-specific)
MSQQPTPYYSDDYVTLYHGDCEDVLPSLSNVGLVLTSPPYNLGMQTSQGKTWGALAGGYDNHDDDMPHSEYVAWQHRVLRLCWATLADDGAIYYQHKPLARGNAVRLPLELNPELPLRQIIIWDRGSGFCRNATHYTPAHEWVLVIARDKFRLSGRNCPDDVWRIPPEAGADHPAPFPLKLATTAIGSTTAQVVLDPFAGSGTTLRAAKDLGRRAIGIEKSERYCEIAAERLAQEVFDFGGVA